MTVSVNTRQNVLCCDMLFWTLAFNVVPYLANEGNGQSAKLVLVATADKRAKGSGQRNWRLASTGVALQNVVLFSSSCHSLLTYLQPYDQSELRPGNDSAFQDHQQRLQGLDLLSPTDSPIVLQHGHHKSDDKQDGHDEGGRALGLLNLRLCLVGPLPLI